MAAVPDDGPARAAVVGALRAAGFAPDAFAYVRAAREVVLEGLVRAEDGLEHVHGVHLVAQRDRVHAIRRRLELELWP